MLKCDNEDEKDYKMGKEVLVIIASIEVDLKSERMAMGVFDDYLISKKEKVGLGKTKYTVWLRCKSKAFPDLALYEVFKREITSNILTHKL